MAVINLIGLALDHPQQPDYKFLKRLDREGRENYVRSHYYTMWRFALRDATQRELGRLAYKLVGVGHFSGLFSTLLPDLVITNVVQQELERAVQAEDPDRRIQLTDSWRLPDSLLTDASLNNTLYVNAWDPWSMVGNGNWKDASLDGYWGRRSDLALRSWPLANPNIKSFKL